MSRFYSDLFPSRVSPNVGLSKRLEGYKLTPRFSLTQILYTFVGDEATGDTVALWKAPKGTIILPHLSGIQMQVDAATTALVVDVGDEDALGVGLVVDPNRYSSGVDCAAVGYKPFAGGVAAALWYKLESDAWITAQYTTVTAPLAGGKAMFSIAYLGA